MSKKCVRCGYVRQPRDLAPPYECPKCGAIYAKTGPSPRKGKVGQKEKSPTSRGSREPWSWTQYGRRRVGKDDDLIKELKLLIRSRYGLICLETIEEERAESLLRHLADHMNLAFFVWTVNRGLQRSDIEKTIYGTIDPKLAMDHIEISRFPAVYHFQGLGPFLEDTVLGAKLTQATRTFTQIDGALILTGTDVQTPDAVKPHTAHLRPSPPQRQDYANLLQYIFRDLSARMQIKVEMSKKDLNRFINNLKGLTLLETEKILTKAFIEDGRLAPDDLKLVIQAKKAIIEREGLLEYFPVEKNMSDIAGLRRLKTWLTKRTPIITDPKRAEQYGLPFPKGILLLGIPGSGKSLCAKAVAMEWGLPLLKMDPSNLYNKYIGESEKNFKRAMATSEKMSPVVLWIDEIEKAFFAGGTEDGGVSQRVLGIFLSWMQERKGDVFVVATSNDVTRLPPELLRKGRFDEIFFVDLPSSREREAIFEIHLKRRGHDRKQFDLPGLATATDGFSGAEIEQIIVSALYTAFSNNVSLSSGLLLEETRKTRPLSKTRSEYVESLREWARGRTVSAQ